MRSTDFAQGGLVAGTLGMIDLKALEREHRLPEGLLKAMIARESAGNAQAVSPKGAIGLMQLMPDTAKELGVDPTNPKENVQGGARYMRQLLDRYKGSLPHALAAYNWGMGNLDKMGFAGMPDETSKYLAAVSDALGQPEAHPDAVNYGEPVPLELAADAGLPADLPGAAALSKMANPAAGGGSQQMPGSPDVDAFNRFMGEMVGSPSKALNEIISPGMKRGGLIDRVLRRKV